MRIATTSSLIVVMGLGASALSASASTATPKKTTLGKVTIAPTIVSGTQYAMTVKKGKKNYVVTFDTGDIKLVNHKGSSIDVDNIIVGNKIKLKGIVDTSSRKITKVSKIKDVSIN